MKNYKELRHTLSRKLPAEFHRRDPLLGFITAGVFGLYCYFFWFAFNHQQWLIPVAVVLGFMAEFLSMANHDILHGSVFKSRLLSVLFCIPNSCVTLIAPSFWKFWHNFHHQSVDRWTTSERPYEMGFETVGYPLLRKWLGPFELFIYKAIHLNKTQIRFLLDDRYTSKNHHDLKKATFIQYAIILAVKITLFVYLPFKIWVWLELIPLLIQNFISSAFLVTQHSQHLDNGKTIRTFSVKLPRWLEYYSLHLGYHVEHHLFPNLPSKYLPRIREILQKEYKDFPQDVFDMGDALKTIYKN